MVAATVHCAPPSRAICVNAQVFWLSEVDVPFALFNGMCSCSLTGDGKPHAVVYLFFLILLLALSAIQPSSASFCWAITDITGIFYSWEYYLDGCWTPQSFPAEKNIWLCSFLFASVYHRATNCTVHHATARSLYCLRCFFSAKIFSPQDRTKTAHCLCSDLKLFAARRAIPAKMTAHRFSISGWRNKGFNIHFLRHYCYCCCEWTKHAVLISH